MVTTGFAVTVKALTGGTCTCTADVISVATGTCTAIPYLDSYDAPWARELIEYTGFGDKIAKRLSGMPSVTISISGGLDLSNAQQLAIYNGLVCSTPTQKIWKIADGGKTFTWKGWVTGSGTGSTPNGKSTFKAEMAVTMLPTIA
jgi:hypothetical protein